MKGENVQNCEILANLAGPFIIFVIDLCRPQLSLQALEHYAGRFTERNI
jgi:hypothetical protein